MALPLPTAWSQAEFDEFYSALIVGGDAEKSEYVFCHTPWHLQKKVNERWTAQPEVLPLPTAWSQAEFDEFYNALIAGATLWRSDYIYSHTPPYLLPKVVENLTTITFDFTPGTLPANAVLTRASTGWTFNPSGVLTAYANDVARFRYDPLTLSLQGLLVEPASTNSIPNNSGTGVVNGSPGTQPTGWTMTTPASGLARQMVGVGVEDGIPYVDYRYSGTASGSSNAGPSFTGTQVVAAAQNQVWVQSYFLRLVGGSVAGLNQSNQMSVGARLAAGGAAGGGRVFNAAAPTAAALRTQRFINVVPALTDVLTAFVQASELFTFTSAAVIDFTMRVGCSQLEIQPAALSPILTTAGAVTRAADILTLSGLSGTRNIAITRVSGVTNLTGIDCSSGSYVVPADPSPVQSVVFAPG